MGIDMTAGLGGKYLKSAVDIGEDDMVADHRVVSDVASSQQHVVVPDSGDPLPMGRAAVDGHVLADDVARADTQDTTIFLAAELLVLGSGAQDGEWEDFAVGAQLGVAFDDHVRL